MSGIQAVRAAAMLRKDLGLDVEVVEGHYGEFTVLADGQPIVRGGILTFLGIMPSLRKVREALQETLKSSGGEENGAKAT